MDEIQVLVFVQLNRTGGSALPLMQTRQDLWHREKEPSPSPTGKNIIRLYINKGVERLHYLREAIISHFAGNVIFYRSNSYSRNGAPFRQRRALKSNTYRRYNTLSDLIHIPQAPPPVTPQSPQTVFSLPLTQSFTFVECEI
ncbi:hypothetical protein J6590_080068 [Homalodisca vitripennis]|nr:hypothetical protein J6590_080068 [Homalodisca vitripennis]